MAAPAKHLAECPECGSDIRLRKAPFIGQLVDCRECDVELVVVGLSPVELDLAVDWDDEDDYEDWDDEDDSSASTNGKGYRSSRMESGRVEKRPGPHFRFDK